MCVCVCVCVCVKVHMLMFCVFIKFSVLSCDGLVILITEMKLKGMCKSRSVATFTMLKKFRIIARSIIARSITIHYSRTLN